MDSPCTRLFCVRAFILLHFGLKTYIIATPFGSERDFFIKLGGFYLAHIPSLPFEKFGV